MGQGGQWTVRRLALRTLGLCLLGPPGGAADHHSEFPLPPTPWTFPGARSPPAQAFNLLTGDTEGTTFLTPGLSTSCSPRKAWSREMLEQGYGGNKARAPAVGLFLCMYILKVKIGPLHS